MKLIKQSHSVITEPDPYKLIELAGRTCYKSEDKITPESSAKFVKMVTKRGHLSVLEHANIIFQVPASVLTILYDLQRSWNSSKVKYLNVSNENVPVVSGNMRAWLELLDQPDLPYNPHLKAIAHYLGYRFPEIFKAVEKSSARVTVLDEDDLTDKEKEIHGTRTVRLITNRGVSHELVRHRPCAFCLSGDSYILRFNQHRDHLTIKELYARQQEGQLRGRNSLMLLRSMNEDNKIVPNSFKQILYSGKKEMYRITTSLGYSLKTSKDHIFFTPSGEQKLKEFEVNDEIFVNGIELIKDKEWLQEQRNKDRPIQEIADEAGVGYSTVRKYLKLYKLTKPIGYKPNTFKPWNKGLTEDNPQVKKQADALRKHHHNNGAGDKNSAWKKDLDDLSDAALRLRFNKYPKIKCECCGEIENLENHHRDQSIYNWRESNKITLCKKCHKAYHFGYNVKHVLTDKITSIEYVGMEDSYDIEMNEPFHNFVADGFIVHNSQESTRYVKYDNNMEFILPVWMYIATGEQIATFELALSRSEEAYVDLLDIGWRPEQAREVLPNSLKTEIVVTATLSEWKHIFKLRCSDKAHPQMRELMRPLSIETEMS